MRRAFRIALLALLTLLAAPAMAGEAEIAALVAVLRPGPTDFTLFSPDFLKAVPPAQIDAALLPLKTSIGPVLDVVPKGGPSYAIETATHEMLADIGLDGTGKIAGLQLHPPVAKTASVDDLLKDWKTAAPQAGWLITRNGVTLAAEGADTPLAVGSAFKLGVLKALRDDIDAGRRHWDDVVKLAATNISLPSGTLQSWPVGSPLTLHTLAALMISISDNTAADALLLLVGRDKVEAVLGIAPVLTTRELFTLKTNAGLKARYQAGDLAQKRAVIAEADALPLPAINGVLTPHDDGVEYDLSPAKLCALIGAVADLDVTQINPGVANKSQWARVSFKGGSEVGVLSFTTQLTAADGTVYCASGIWNGPAALDEGAIGIAYGSVLAKLAKG
ncbi:MAG: serine hydrolase [Devosia sp.]